MFRILAFLSLLSLLTSCQTSNPLFSNLENPVLNDSLSLQFLKTVEPVLKTGDKITMSIWNHNDLSIGSVNSIYTSNESTGKWLQLDDEGKVNLPKIGRIKIAGLTVKEVNYFLEKTYAEILKDPIINVRVLNHFVTVLGEVSKPGRYSLDNESISLVEILGMAKGLTAYSKNEEIELIRIVKGQSIKLRVNLTDLAILPSKNIILQPDDIVHVGATKAKVNDRNLGKASLITSIVTGLAVIFSVFVK